jgi:hypothetical protein
VVIILMPGYTTPSALTHIHTNNQPAIMILAGDYIEMSIGVTLGISTMAVGR